MRIPRTRYIKPQPPEEAQGTLALQIVTTWFDYPVRPLHVGEYEVQVSVLAPVIRMRWNGLVWTDPFDRTPAPFQQYRWRGLAEKPEQAEE